MFWKQPTASKRTKLISISEDLRRFPGIKDTPEEILQRWLRPEELAKYGVLPTERFVVVESAGK